MMMSKKITLLAILLVAIICFGQWSNTADQNQLIANQIYDETSPKIIHASNGYTYLSWFSKELSVKKQEKAYNYNMRLQLLDPQGIKQFGAEGLLVSNELSQSWMTDYALSVDSSNNAIITFQDYRNSLTTINAYKISLTGQFLWGSKGISLSTNLPGAHYAPFNIVLSNNKVVIAWSYFSSGNVEKICITKLEADGSFTWADSIRQLSYEGSDNKRFTLPKLVHATGDDFILQYSCIGKLTSAKNRWLMARKYNGDGALLWDTLIYNQGEMTFSTKTFVKSDDNGGLIISWSDDRNLNNMHEPYIQHLDSNGSLLFQVNGLQITLGITTYHTGPRFAYNKISHEYIIFWDVKSPNQNDQGIYMQKINQSGQRLWGDEGKVIFPLIAFRIIENNLPQILSDGNFILFYNIFSPGNSFNNEIRVTKIDPDGNFLWSEQSKAISSVVSNKTFLNVYPDALGQNWFLCWSDSRNSDDSGYDIYSQNVNSDGVLGLNAPSSILADNSLDADIQLVGNYPNPFNPETEIKFLSNSTQLAKLSIFNSNGEVVKEHCKLEIAKGLNSLKFSAVNLNSGVYFYRITTTSSAKFGKMILVK